jgi:hypothetical protein
MSKRHPLSLVYHVGSLDKNNLNSRPNTDFSLEGNGLSVSQCPEDWKKIAKLGGLETYVLEKSDPNFFMAHESGNEKAIEWCIDQEYLIPAKKYRAYITDEEGDEMYFEYESQKKAAEESEDVRPADGYIFGEKGKAYWKNSFQMKIDHAMAESFAVIFYAQSQGYDGVWWNDVHDVGSLSAPRGVIFQDKLSSWTIK